MSGDFELYTRRNVLTLDRHGKNEFYDICGLLELWGKLIFTELAIHGYKQSFVAFFDFGNDDPKSPHARMILTNNKDIAAMKTVADPKRNFANNSTQRVRLIEYEFASLEEMMPGKDGFPIPINKISYTNWSVEVTVNRVCKIDVENETFAQASMEVTKAVYVRTLGMILAQSNRFMRKGASPESWTDTLF